MSEITLPKVKVNGIEVYYEVHGEGSPLVLINGYTASSEGWQPELLNELSKHHKIITCDNRGTGRSDKPSERYSIKTMADDIAGLLDNLNISKTHVFGISMGGTIAQELALNHKEKVTSLTLCSTFCGGKKSVFSAEVNEVFFDNLSKGMFPDVSQEGLLEFALTLAYSPNYLKAHRDEIYSNMSARKYPTPPETWVRHAQAIADFDVYDRLPEISVPTLLLHGGDDIFVPPINSRIIQWRINGSKRVVLENVGHNLHIEAREKFVTLMLDFMKNVDG